MEAALALQGPTLEAEEVAEEGGLKVGPAVFAADDAPETGTASRNSHG